MLKELDQRLEEDPEDGRALVYRANASYFRTDGASEAARHYRTALTLADDPVIRSNLERLLAERTP
jgi:Tfp pilus assembly protein PilF